VLAVTSIINNSLRALMTGLRQAAVRRLLHQTARPPAPLAASRRPATRTTVATKGITQHRHSHRRNHRQG